MIKALKRIFWISLICFSGVSTASQSCPPTGALSSGVFDHLVEMYDSIKLETNVYTGVNSCSLDKVEKEFSL